MRVGPGGDLELTYCTNIHPSTGWDEVRGNLDAFAPALKHSLAPNSPFGVGLRVSAAECNALLTGNRLSEFQAYLEDHDLYVRLLNGFVHGSFHRQVVKAEAFAPDWRDEARVAYTLSMVQILGTLLPEGSEGGISTPPLSYKRWVHTGDRGMWEAVTQNIVRIAAALFRLRQISGKLIHLDIEPEPDGLVESTPEVVAFFTDWLFTHGAPYLAADIGVSADEAVVHLREHVRVCVDCCHLAVEYETPEPMWRQLSTAGIKIGRLQVSSALEAALPEDPAARTEVVYRLKPFADSTYLHQVIERTGDGVIRRHRDLDDALVTAAKPGTSLWRIHFHVPLFVEEYEGLSSTQSYTLSALELLQRTGFARHLEIETYTWDVLPPGMKIELLDSVAREYRWVLDQFHGGAAL